MVPDLDSENPLNVPEAAGKLLLRKLQALSGLRPLSYGCWGKTKNYSDESMGERKQQHPGCRVLTTPKFMPITSAFEIWKRSPSCADIRAVVGNMLR